jgi:subtilisin-like proprotein convertase family protein
MRVCLRIVFALAFLIGCAGDASAARFLITGADAGGGPHVIIRADTDQNGTFETITDSFYAFAPAFPGAPLFSGGVRVATCDIDGDGNDELVTAMGPGGNVVRIWRLNGGGRVTGLVDELGLFGTFAGGINVACGDFDADGRDEVVTAADAGGGPSVRVWTDSNRNGKVFDNLLADFLAYAAGFSGGVRVAAGNINNTGGDELITAPGPGGSPHIRILTFTGGVFVPIEEFMAYTPVFTGGVYIAAGAISSAGSGGAELITAAGAGGIPHVRIFTDSNSNGAVSDNPTFDEFLAYSAAFSGGVRVAVGDTDQSGFFVEVVTIAGPGGTAHVRIFDDNGDAGSALSDNPTSDEFLAYNPAWGGGGFVAVANYLGNAFSFPSFPMTIPDNSTLNVEMCLPAGSGIIRDLDVGLDIFHSFDGDLDVSLTHINTGTSMILFNDVGGSNEGFLIRLNDQAGTDISTATNPKPDGAINGTFNPGGAALLSVFNGQDAGGCWRLTIVDDSAADSGTLFNWILYFTF